MWVIFLIGAIITFFVAVMAAWIINRVLIGIKRDNYKYDLEVENDSKCKNIKDKGDQEE